MKTGTVGQDPATKWGYFAYHRNSGAGSIAIEHYNARGLTWQDVQFVGGPLRFVFSTTGQAFDDITLRRVRHRMGAAGGIGFSQGVSDTIRTYSNLQIIDPDCDSGEALVADKGEIQQERSTQNGIAVVGNADGVYIYNPKVRGYSHSQIMVQPFSDSLTPDPDVDTYPRNCHIIVNDTDDGKGVLTGGPNYQRGINFHVAFNGRVGPVRFSQMTVQSQLSGDVRMSGYYFDNTCVAYSDEYSEEESPGTPNGKWNMGCHISCGMSSGDAPDVASPRFRFFGGKHDLVAEHALAWATSTATSASVPDDCIDFTGGLVRDSGHVRYDANRRSLANSTWTRRKAAFLARATGSTTRGAYQSIKRSKFILDPACEGIAAAKIASTSIDANANNTTWPIVTTSAPGVWGASRVSGNVEATSAADFDFDEDLNYIGVRKTPIQTSSRPGRGYR